LVRAVKRQLGEVTAEERGPLLEGYVLTMLRAHAQSRHLYDDVHYWAPAQGGVEVDFVLRRDDELLAIEVKSAPRFSRPLVRGLNAVADLDRLVRRVLVYGGRRELRTEGGIEVWPLSTFAQALATDELWP
jgi:predicted AAA+ superfamily ATPase